MTTSRLFTMATFLIGFSVATHAQQNNMFPPINNSGAPAAAQAPAAPAAPVTAYSAPPAPAEQLPPQQQVPFDPSQFQQGGQFNPGQFPGTPRTLPPQRPREETFVPSEVVSVLPPAARASELRAVLRTSMGDVTIKLDRLNTPNTVNHFVSLARGDKEFVDVKTSKRVKRPFYNGLTFHRVSKGFLVQTGCPFGNGRGGPGDIAMVPDEIAQNAKFDRPGLVAMAPMRDEKGTEFRKNSNGSQFFITLRAMPEWDDKFTVIGEVEEGLDVVQKIASVKVGPTERPIKRIFLVSVDIFEGSADQQQQVPPAAPSEAPAQ